MGNTETFIDEITKGYSFKGDYITLGTAVLDGNALPATPVSIPLSTINRHGLVAGATGSGKTKTLQVLCEQLSDKGVSVLIMDIKGDVSGMAQPGAPNPKIDERMQKIGMAWKPTGYPVELMSISNDRNVMLRATVSEFGPVLFSKILELNDIQQGAVALVFKYCDDKGYPLLDLKDFRKTLHYLTNEGKDEIAEEYGKISPSSAGAILRKVVEIEEQGADRFFGERSFDVSDLVRTNDKGQGFISILRLNDIQSRPKLFSTFMLSLLAEVYSSFPELGDKAAPKLVMVIDEAHLIFNEASRTLLNQIETIIKLIRSKGVGIFFCTQLPTDVPPEVLSQLGLKVQHALRAFTANDRKAIKLTAENYPLTDYYQTDVLLTKLGIGEAIITALNEKGVPTPLVHTLLRAPQSRMDVLTDAEIQAVNASSALFSKYNTVVDRESAYEILEAKLNRSRKMAEEETGREERRRQDEKDETANRRGSRRRQRSLVERVVTSSAFNTVLRGVFNILIKK